MIQRLRRAIILEGPDGTGKTTLGKRLGEEFGVPYFYAGGPPAGDKGIRETCELQLKRTASPCVLDRVSFISELCYRAVMDPVFVARSQVSVTRYLALALKNRPIIVFCMAEGGLERATRETYEEDDFTAQLRVHMPAIIARYHRVFAEIANGYRVLLRYDFTETTHDELIENILTMDKRDDI